jgi:uncharacterized LabA/DUF88 family protein
VGQERLYVACDVSNLWRACRREFGVDARLDFEALGNLVPTLRRPADVTQRLVAYIVSHYKTKNEAFVEALSGFGYTIRERRMAYEKFKATEVKPTRTDWDVGITIDAIDLLNEYDTFVLMSGDGDFSQLLDYLRLRGKRTLVASFESSLAGSLYVSAHDVVKLDRSIIYQVQPFSRIWSW